MIFLFALIVNSFAYAQDFLLIDPTVKQTMESAWDNTQYDNTQISFINPSTHFAVSSPLNLVVFADSKWTTDIVLEELRGIERVYAQCEVSFSPITLVQTTTKAARKWWSDFDPASDAKIFDVNLMTPAPTIIYRKSGGAYSWPQYYLDDNGGSALFPQLLNNAVVSFANYKVNKELDYVPKDYVTSAHELAHIFLNSQHRGLCGDLIHGGPTCKGSNLPAEDCTQIREFLK
jgi:hypothetical protein